MAAPSLMPDELAAVMVPWGSKLVLSEASFSAAARYADARKAGGPAASPPSRCGS